VTVAVTMAVAVAVAVTVTVAVAVAVTVAVALGVAVTVVVALKVHAEVVLGLRRFEVCRGVRALFDGPVVTPLLARKKKAAGRHQMQAQALAQVLAQGEVLRKRRKETQTSSLWSIQAAKTRP